MAEYREGNEEGVLDEQDEEKAARKKENNIETAILVITFDDGRVDVATEIPQMEMKRKSNVKDIRNACRTVYDDMTLMMTAQSTSAMVQQGLAEYAARAMENQKYNKIVSNMKNPGQFLKKAR